MAITEIKLLNRYITVFTVTYTDAIPYQNSYFGTHLFPSGIYFNCFGNETSLSSCQSSTSSISSCGSDDAAGVHCRGDVITGTHVYSVYFTSACSVHNF